jgi:hypothetical protein
MTRGKGEVALRITTPPTRSGQGRKRTEKDEKRHGEAITLQKFLPENFREGNENITL